MTRGNGAASTWGYWGTGGAYDTTGGYYGRLWDLTTVRDGTKMQLRHTWDSGGNLASRFDVLTSDNETFGYDYLDRLTSVSGNYTASYAYNELGNITNMNGSAYTYGSKPHAVTQVGSTTYTYDANGNMLTRGSDNITWDAENRPTSIVTSNGTSAFVYDGDGRRMKKTEGGHARRVIHDFVWNGATGR